MIKYYISLLLKKQEEINFNLILKLACQLGNYKLAKLAIKHNANNYNVGLEKASQFRRVKLVGLMLHHGANNLNKALENSCEYGSLKCTKLLLQNKADNYNDGLIKASKYGYLEIVKLMVELKADNFTDALQVTSSWCESVVIYLLDRGKDTITSYPDHLKQMRMMEYLIAKNRIYCLQKMKIKISDIAQCSIINNIIPWKTFKTDMVTEIKIYRSLILKDLQQELLKYIQFLK
jgi:hypothetical protein